MTTVDLIRRARSRRAALYTYARAHDRFSDEEQILAGAGRTTDAELAHRYALITLRAYRAELDDPEPRT